jgi:hypothetical protein
MNIAPGAAHAAIPHLQHADEPAHYRPGDSAIRKVSRLRAADYVDLRGQGV